MTCTAPTRAMLILLGVVVAPFAGGLHFARNLRLEVLRTPSEEWSALETRRSAAPIGLLI